MPLPLVPIAIAAVVGLFGAKKGIDAHSDNKKAKNLDLKAQKRFDNAKKALEKAREKCTSDLESLGRIKFEIWDRQLGRFVALFSQLRNIEVVGASKVEQLGSKAFPNEELAQMQELSAHASEVVSGGATAIGSGALVGMASYGGATMLASASTGTAISTLGGAAATNATLAWFGGGSLATGGLGVAGGTAVLGGLVAAPVLAVGGLILAAKARKNLAEARGNLAKVKKAASEMRTAASLVEGIRKVASQFLDVTVKLDDRFTPVLDDLDAMIAQRQRRWRWLPWKVRINFAKLSEAEQRTAHFAYLFAQTLKIVLEAPLLTPKGALSRDYPQALEAGRQLIFRDDKDVA